MPDLGKSAYDLVTKTGFITTGGANNPGTSRYINSASSTFKGWAVVLQLDIVNIFNIAIIKAIANPLSVTTDTIVRLYEMDSGTIPAIDTTTLIQEWTVTAAQWNAITTSNEYLLQLTNAYTVKPNKYYAVTVWNTNGINIIQVGYNPQTSETSANGPTNSYYKQGQWTPNIDNTGYRSTSSGGAYGLYCNVYASNPVSKVRIDPKQLPEHEQSIKDNAAAISTLQASANKIGGKYSFVHEVHYENPLVKKCPTFLDHWLRRDKDMYVLLSGDSIFAWMTATQKAKAGVAAVPPSCDKRAFAGLMWELIQFGSPLYRRFDYGKNALVGSWDATWASADAPVFTESGTFDTYYYSGTNGQNAYDANLTSVAITSKITQRTCPITKFGYSDNNRHIPKRISNTASASVSFTIPAGYKKFDFIYETNQQGDDMVTVAITQGAGKVNVNANDRDFTTPVEANGFTFSMKELKDESNDGYDSAIPGKRLFFQKTNISDSITVTITKSTDTTKYLLYWGISYWSTATEPNACHIINSARGSSRMTSIYSNRFYRYTGVVPKPDLVIQECTLINNSSDSTDPSSYLTQFNQVADYMNTIPLEYFFVMSHAHKDRLVEPYIRYWDTAKAEVIKKGYSYVDVQKILYKQWQLENPNQEVSWQTYFTNLMYDAACHPNDAGFDFYKILMEPIFDLI